MKTDKNPAQILREFMNRIANPVEESASKLVGVRDPYDFSSMMNLTEGQKIELESIKKRCPALYKKIVGLE